jgi:N-acetylglutamate synthase-like GNAT family acetyltransferase
MTQSMPTTAAPVVRRANEHDAHAVLALLSQLGPQFAPDPDVFHAAYSDVMAQGDDNLLFVADLGDAVVGYALATIARLFFTNGDSAQIHELVVDDGARGRGVGSLLVSAIENECRARGVKQLTVATLRSAAFYERLDYRSTADFLKKRFDE